MLENLAFITLSFCFGAFLSYIACRKFFSSDSQVTRLRETSRYQQLEIRKIYEEIKLNITDLRNKFNTIQYQITEFYLQLENTEAEVQKSFNSKQMITNEKLKKNQLETNTKAPLTSNTVMQNKVTGNITPVNAPGSDQKQTTAANIKNKLPPELQGKTQNELQSKAPDQPLKTSVASNRQAASIKPATTTVQLNLQTENKPANKTPLEPNLEPKVDAEANFKRNINKRSLKL